MTDRQVHSEPFSCQTSFRAGHHYEVDPVTGCWEWLLSKFRGYAMGGGGRAYRRAYEDCYGPIPEGLDAHHVCHNPACVNPEHLELVTRTEHLERHKQASSNLTGGDVVRIRERAAASEPFREIVKDYDVSEDAIFLIVKGETWKNVGGPIGKPPRTCLWCGKPIGPERNHGARYCSPSHRTNYNSRRRRERLQLAGGFRK